MIATIKRTDHWKWIQLALVLSKPPVTLMLVFTALVAAVAAGREMLEGTRLVLLTLAGLFACAGSAWINHYLDRDIDAAMSRTRSRPLPNRRADGAAVLAGGVMLIATGVRLALLINVLVALFVLLGALTYTVVYTGWFKRRTAWNIVIGGAAGSFAVLAGWATFDPMLSSGAWMLALLLFLWTPPHFWSFAIVYAEDYRRAGVPMLPSLIGASRCAWIILAHALALIGLSAAFALTAATGWVYSAAAAFAAFYFLYPILQLLRDPHPRRAWKSYKASNIYLGLLLLGLLLDARF